MTTSVGCAGGDWGRMQVSESYFIITIVQHPHARRLLGREMGRSNSCRRRLPNDAARDDASI
jgi:hypothetical protein